MKRKIFSIGTIVCGVIAFILNALFLIYYFSEINIPAVLPILQGFFGLLLVVFAVLLLIAIKRNAEKAPSDEEA